MRKPGSGTFSAITDCPLGCLAFKQVTGLGLAAEPATSALMMSTAPSQPEGGAGGGHSLPLSSPPSTPGMAASPSKAQAGRLGVRINICWGSELVQSIIWGLPGRGGSRRLASEPARADLGALARGGGRGSEPHHAQAVLTQQSAGPAPADAWPSCPLCAVSYSSPGGRLPVESRAGNQTRSALHEERKEGERRQDAGLPGCSFTELSPLPETPGWWLGSGGGGWGF